MTGIESGVNYDPYDLEINADPYPVYRRLREEAPIYYNEKYDFWALSPPRRCRGSGLQPTRPSHTVTEPSSR